ncbi:hypothetical protein ESZ50_01270 [Weissella muntiaci]|uniref:YopX protein domain-containing protein n=1 Tax=Weissella muntiaci TaxID=2508881 RepID=A0A6C2CCI0_9LACO|nr:YopX family protein [Weissella muntiaci]TYC50875.1 hypothetical protein ESZ50_01270 [Weissella muntiaci]
MAQREIKFRAWLEYYQEKGFIDEFDINQDGVVFINVFGEEEMYPVDSKRVTLEQYAEMYGEEDISIYDGDVIKVWDNGIGQVVFENGVFKVDFKDGRKYPLELWWQDFISGKAPDNPYKVLGNIHENPELLEAE